MEVNGVLATCRELGITFIPYSPLGRGFLTGAIQKLEDLDPSDWRRTNPRFGEKALQENLKLAAAVKELAGKKARRQHNWRWPGFWRRAKTLCPSLGQNEFVIWRTTWARCG